MWEQKRGIEKKRKKRRNEVDNPRLRLDVLGCSPPNATKVLPFTMLQWSNNN